MAGVAGGWLAESFKGELAGQERIACAAPLVQEQVGMV
jgi:hypothetical protein